MPEDSRTNRLLDNGLQATIAPQSLSPTPLSLYQFAFDPGVLPFTQCS